MELPLALSRLRLFAVFCLLPCPVHGASLNFGQALQLALHHNANPGQGLPAVAPPRDSGEARTARPAETERSCPVLLADYSGIAAQLESANESTPLPANPFLNLRAGPAPAGAFDLRSRKNILLCTALVYALFEGTHAQKLVLREQQSFVNRLLEIESRRVSAEVDHPLRLTQAKLMRAKVSMISQALDATEHEARAALSALTGATLDDSDPAGNSMPLLPENAAATVEDKQALKQLLAFRDIAQLDYVSGFLSRLKVTHDMALAKASIGDLVAAHIDEGMKLIALLHVNDHVRAAKIQMLGASDRLESWTAGSATSNAGELQGEQQSPDAVPANSPEPRMAGSQTPPILSVLLTPAIHGLQAGRSQQFSAIATYSDGHAKDVTSEAHWSCSTDTLAILSATGLLTGLAAGQVTVHVDFKGIERSRGVSVTARAADEYLLAGH